MTVTGLMLINFTINTKKSNFVIFRPAQKRINPKLCIRIPVNNNNGFALLERKDYVKFLGVLIDKNLTWRPHTDHITSKISKIVGIIARLMHHVPLNTLLQFYRSLIFPYTLYCVPVWGQASQCDLKQILTLQKHVLCLIFFASKRSHAIPLGFASNILPVNMLYFETVSTIMHDVSTHSTPKYIFLYIHLTFMHITRLSHVQIIFI